MHWTYAELWDAVELLYYYAHGTIEDFCAESEEPCDPRAMQAEARAIVRHLGLDPQADFEGPTADPMFWLGEAYGRMLARAEALGTSRRRMVELEEHVEQAIRHV